MTERLNGGLFDWIVGWLIDWLVGLLGERLINWRTDWVIDWFVFLVGWLIKELIEWLVDSFIHSLVSWRLIGWKKFERVRLTDGLDWWIVWCLEAGFLKILPVAYAVMKTRFHADDVSSIETGFHADMGQKLNLCNFLSKPALA